MNNNCQPLKLITLSGLDGSGKSTQIEMLKDYLESQDKTFWYFHAVEFSVGNMWRSNLHRGDSISTGSVTKANWIEIQLRKIALLIDICRFKKMMKKKNVDYIISDRYFYDSVINISYLSSCHFERSVAESRDLGENIQDPSTSSCCRKTSVGMTKIGRLIPKPDFAFFIKVSPEKIMERDRKPDQGMEYLKAKEKLFEEKIKEWNMIAVDGERAKNDIFNEIKSQVWGGTS
jgi:thymidylate kinase